MSKSKVQINVNVQNQEFLAFDIIFRFSGLLDLLDLEEGQR
jgi:hypothetical protein